MTDHHLTRELNAIADALNEVAAKLEAVTNHPAMRALRLHGDQATNFSPNVGCGSPLSRMTDQCERAAATLPEPCEPTKWVG
jgi:hypothetical protein